MHVRMEDGISSTLLRRLQSIQNAAALGHWSQDVRSHHTSATRTSLAADPPAHCVQVVTRGVQVPAQCCTSLSRQRLRTVSSLARRRQLRSSVSGTLDSQRTRTVLGRRAFRVCGPATWNALSSVDRTAYCCCVSWRFRETTENLLVRERLLTAH